MKFVPTSLAGVYRVEPERLTDERGFFARTWCADEMRAQGLDAELSQCSISCNLQAGTLRGMHWQAEPHAEAKLVRCTRGAIHDVALDLRPDSSTFKQWFSAKLTADNHSALFIPPGVAHGFQTMSDDSEVLYQISTPYHAASARGLRWDDPAFGIVWPAAPSLISSRDQAYPDYRPDGAI